MAIRKYKIPNIIILVVVLLIFALLVFWDQLFRGHVQVDETTKPVTPAAKKTELRPDVPAALAKRYKDIAAAIDVSRVRETVNTLSAYPSRMAGYPGCEKAADYVEQQFRASGLKNIRIEKFPVTVPVDEGSKLVVNGRQIPIYALWPNLVRTSQLPPEGLEVHLIDAGSGRLPDFDDKAVQGSAALVDFNSGTEWLNAPRLGAKALIFVEPDDTMRGEAEAKFSAIPVSMPRFWISKANAERLRAMLRKIAADNASVPPIDRPKLMARLYCKMPWEKAEARNITGVIRGSDPKLRNEWIVLHSHYDSISVVPAIAPGAESTCGIAGLIELAKLFGKHEFRPKRSVLFIATSGHFQGLAGMREYFERHIDSYAYPGTLDSFHSFLSSNWPAKGGGEPAFIIPLIVLIVLALIINGIRVKLAGPMRRYAWLKAVPIVLAALSIYYVAGLYVSFSKGFDYKVPNPPKFYVWAGLDLSSQTQGVGIFFKGYFYDYREDLQGKFSDLAGRSRNNSERVASVLGFFDQRTHRFADGVNPIQGKDWRNFVPGKFALDSEVATLAGGRGVSFVSIDDGRPMVDTPFDTVNRINFANLRDQLVMIGCLTDHWFRDTNIQSNEEWMPARIVDKRNIAVNDPLQVGYVVGVYAGQSTNGKNYYIPRSDKDMPASLLKGTIRLTAKLPKNVKKVYVLQKPLTKLGVTDECKFTRMGLQGGFARLSGSVVEYDPRRSFVPNLKVSDCLAVVRSPHKSFMGVRACIIDKTTRKDGKFTIPGVAPVTAYTGPHPTSTGAYKLDPVKGDIICAPDQGSYGEFYPTEFLITTGFKDMPIIVFNCKATSIYDLIDPQSLNALSGISVYDGDTNGAPKQFGMAVAVPEPQNPHVEDMGVIFTEDTRKAGSKAIGSSSELKRVRIKLVMSAGPAAIRLLLLNSTIGTEVVPAKLKSVGARAIPTTSNWQVDVEGLYLNKDGKGGNYYRSDPTGLDNPLQTGVVTVSKPLPKNFVKSARQVYVKTNKNRVVAADLIKVISIVKPWYVHVQGVYTDPDCNGTNYMRPAPDEALAASLATDQVCAAANLPDVKNVYLKTDAGVLKSPIEDFSMRAVMVDRKPLQIRVQGIYDNKDCKGASYFNPVAAGSADMFADGGPLLTASVPGKLYTRNLWIKTNQPDLIQAKVARVATIDRPVDFFVSGLYTNPKFKGTNYCAFKTGVFNNESLLRGEIQLTKKLPAKAGSLYIKPLAHPEGIGYDMTDGGTLDETAYKVAHDMWTLDQSRLSTLESHGVVNEGLSDLHREAKKLIDKADAAKGSLNYSVFDSFCRAAWGYEARAYPDVTTAAQDVVNGVIFYLFLMLPFAYFCERLFFAFPDMKWQLLAFFSIFIAVFVIFKFVHPAFQIAGDAFIVLIAFIMLALSLLVIFIITSKFEEQLKQFNRSVSGIHKADIGRMSVAAAAFSLGISNMRRRKARTVLTCITLILLTFTVLSFTSIVSVLRFNKVPAHKDSDTHLYEGIMIRTALWEPMQEIGYRLLKDEFGNEGKRGKIFPVAPRAWFFGTVMGEQSFLTVKRGNKSFDARAAVGTTPDEAEIMDFETKNKNVFVAGDWFGYKNGVRVKKPVNPYSMIIPTAIAKKLQINPEDVGKAQVEFAGAKYTVIGIIKNDVFKKIKDLDNEPLTPVDFIMMNKQGAQQSGGEAGFREYTHLEPNNVFFIPYDTAMSMGGVVRSIAIKFAKVEEVQKQLDALMPRLDLNLYAGVGNAIYRYSSIGGSSSTGFSNVFIPILIAALIVLNTMLGSVFERVREIGIFSSIGLAPNHIAVLFIAESMVYANLGAVAGYVVGQAASKLLMETNLLPGLYLNFSSMSAVTATMVVVAVVLLSTLYPARKASEVATPAIDRSWKVPDPVGDNWDIVLPFSVTGEQAVGVNGFLKEWFQAYEEYSIGDFVTQDVESSETTADYGTAYIISCKAWLAPFDLGVSQRVALRTEPTDMEDVFEVKLCITRESGDISNWKRVNRRFLNTLRKQFLIWRTLKEDERDKYMQAAETVEEPGAQPAPA